MKRCTILANCQAHGVALYLKRLGFPYEIEVFENYKIMQGLVSVDDAIKSARKCDVFLCQPTSELRHINKSSEFFIREVLSKHARVAVFPYVWNDGQHPLFPAAAPLFYQGYDAIKNQLIGRPLDDILTEYDKGVFDFHLVERFRRCVDETIRREREENTDIAIGEWMWENRSQRLMLSYNHPTSIVHAELAWRICYRFMECSRCKVVGYNEPELPSELPLSGFVVKAFGMQEPPHPGSHNLYRRMLADAHARANGDVNRPPVNTAPYIL